MSRHAESADVRDARRERAQMTRWRRKWITEAERQREQAPPPQRHMVINRHVPGSVALGFFGLVVR